MALQINKPFWQALSLGTLAGMRSMSAPAVVSHILSHHHSRSLENTKLDFMQTSGVATTLKVLASAELVGDKVPGAPDRTKPAVLITRMLSGALAGASIYKASGNNAITGALLGTAAATLSSFAFLYLRKTAVKHTKLVDPIVGGIEDALVLSSGVALATTA